MLSRWILYGEMWIISCTQRKLEENAKECERELKGSLSIRLTARQNKMGYLWNQIM